MTPTGIFDDLLKEYNHVKYEIEKIDRQVERLRTLRDALENEKIMLWGVLQDYGIWKYEGYEARYELKMRDKFAGEAEETT